MTVRPGWPFESHDTEEEVRAALESNFKARQARDKLFAWVCRLAERREAPDAMEVLLDGGPLVLEEHEYVQGLLDMVNQPSLDKLSGDYPNTPISEFTPEMLGMLRKDGRSYKRRELRPEKGNRIYIEILNRVITDPTDLASRLLKYCCETIKDRIVRVPIFDDRDGSYVDRTVIANKEAAEAYVFLLLIDPKREYASQLRRCKLDTCHKFFLDRETRPGQRRVYCTEECASAAEKEDARRRAREWREEQKQRALRKARGKSK